MSASARATYSICAATRARHPVPSDSRPPGMRRYGGASRFQHRMESCPSRAGGSSAAASGERKKES
eukprot:scaffold4195_cov92-Isochrysis_galbana.AAC.1